MSLELFLAPIEPVRREAVRAWLSTGIGGCHDCGRPVRPIDPRKTGKDGLVHLDCRAGGQHPAESPAEVVSAAVEARGRRSDWG
jgi:hypothetical protein